MADYGLCKCGCGQKTTIARQGNPKLGYKAGEPHLYMKGHHPRAKLSMHGMWNGGKTKTSHGYIRVKEPSHPRETEGYVYEHILAVEKVLGHFLPDKAEIHHVNNDHSDNRHHNLVACEDRNYHRLIHKLQRRRAKQMGDERERGVVKYVAKDGVEITLTRDIVKKQLVKGRPEFVTDPELLYVMGVCRSRGLNPFTQDCYILKYTQNDPAAIITSIDFFRRRARAQQDCVGWKSGISLVNLDGKLEHREGTILLDGEKLVGGWFKAKPVGWEEPMFWTVPLKGFIKKTREGNPTQFWSEEKQPGQIAKVAESQGLRKLWPDEFQALYTDAESQVEALSEFDRILSGDEAPTGAQPPQAEKANGKGAQKEQTIEERFWAIIPKGYDRKLVEEFVAIVANNNNVDTDAAKLNAINNPEPFKKFLGAWLDKIKKKQDAAPPQAKPAETPAPETIVEPATPTKEEKQDPYVSCPDGGYVQKEDCSACPQKPSCEAWK